MALKIIWRIKKGSNKIVWSLKPILRPTNNVVVGKVTCKKTRKKDYIVKGTSAKVVDEGIAKGLIIKDIFWRIDQRKTKEAAIRLAQKYKKMIETAIRKRG